MREFVGPHGPRSAESPVVLPLSVSTRCEQPEFVDFRQTSPTNLWRSTRRERVCREVCVRPDGRALIRGPVRRQLRDPDWEGTYVARVGTDQLMLVKLFHCVRDPSHHSPKRGDGQLLAFETEAVPDEKRRDNVFHDGAHCLRRGLFRFLKTLELRVSMQNLTERRHERRRPWI